MDNGTIEKIHLNNKKINLEINPSMFLKTAFIDCPETKIKNTIC